VSDEQSSVDRVEPVAEPLRLYGTESEAEALPWSWVDAQLRDAGTYWVVAKGDGHPHPRPVWGVWLDGQLQLTLGSPVLRRQLATDAAVTVHLESGTEVVLVEGHAGPDPASEATALAAYDAKYDYRYSREEYGPFTVVRPTQVLAWRTAGPAGRDGFRQVGRWRFA
jgi:hypothetical protein